MKTTIEISDALLLEAKKMARKKNTTLRELVELGLREAITKHQREKNFKLRKATFKGSGLNPEFQGEGWQKIRSTIYEGRGG